MKIFLRLSLSAFAVMFLFNAFAVTETKAQPQREALKRLEKHYQTLKSLRASVKMEKKNTQLGVSDVSEGTVIYLPQKGRDAYIRIDWTKPVEESLAVVNKEYVLYRPRLKQALVGKIDNAKGNAGVGNAFAFLNMSKDQLNANYVVRYIGQETVNGSTGTWHLELTPRTKQSYKTADLWINTNGMPIMAKITENNDDTTTISLSNLKENETIDGSVFAINLPKGVKKIEG